MTNTYVQGKGVFTEQALQPLSDPGLHAQIKSEPCLEMPSLPGCLSG
jgi:hypothetical protein